MPGKPFRRAGAALRCHSAAVVLSLLLLALAGCAAPERAQGPTVRPAEVRARIVRLLPAGTSDREGWARDITAAFAALGIEPSNTHLCSVLAVTAQESGYTVDPVVPGLAKIARAEIDRRAARLHVPRFAVTAALRITSPNGKRYDERLAKVRTERELSLLYEDLIGSVPLGERLFADANPVHTGGPMQVSIEFAEQHARGYPYPVQESIRHEVFTRRGGMYFGIAHLLDYPAAYDKPLYRFADFNAGRYASRNAAFQQAVSLASGIPLALDGDLVAAGDDPGPTEIAVRSLGKRIGMGDRAIRSALERGNRADFDRETLYERVFDLAQTIEGHPLARAVVPRIRLESPKITRKLTTAWFAQRVDTRHAQCMAKARG
jgi:hypothetical protein